MADKQFNARIRWKRDTSANWTSNNPVLLNGEIIIVDTDSGEMRFKIGDGVKTYTQLPFEDEVVRNLININTSAITKLNGDDTTEGSVAKAIADAKSIIDADIDAVEVKADAAQTSVDNLANTVAYINKEDNENIESPDIAASSIIIDSALSKTSANPVQNATITAELDTIKDAKADWNQNDETAIDYIKNRPFYTISSTENTLLDGTFAFENGQYSQQNSTIDFEANQEYTVIFDGVSYNCIAFMIDVENNVFGIGNGAIINSEYPNSGEPFFIGASTAVGELIILANPADTTHTITIKFIKENVQTMDKKYLPIIDVAHGGTGRSTIADTEYTTAKYRASALVTTKTYPKDNGVIYWVYE